MQTTQLGPLKAVITPPLTPEESRLTVVLLHGFGAPGTDLIGLSGAFGPMPGVRFVFPAAPLSLDEYGAPAGARAWWPIDMIRLQVARMTGQHEALAQETPQGLSEARHALDEALTALKEKYDLPAEQLVVGGFSQGAMLACDWALHSDWPIGGLVQLSGTLISEPVWKKLLPGRSGLATFQSHSPDDEVLPMTNADRLALLMRQAGLRHEFVSFRGGHGIPQPVLVSLRKFLLERLSDAPD